MLQGLELSPLARGHHLSFYATFFPFKKKNIYIYIYIYIYSFEKPRPFGVPKSTVVSPEWDFECAVALCDAPNNLGWTFSPSHKAVGEGLVRLRGEASSRSMWVTVDGSEIRLTSWYGEYLNIPLFTGFLLHSKCCRISSINSMDDLFGWCWDWMMDFLAC